MDAHLSDLFTGAAATVVKCGTLFELLAGYVTETGLRSGDVEASAHMFLAAEVAFMLAQKWTVEVCATAAVLGTDAFMSQKLVINGACGRVVELATGLRPDLGNWVYTLAVAYQAAREEGRVTMGSLRGLSAVTLATSKVRRRAQTNVEPWPRAEVQAVCMEAIQWMVLLARLREPGGPLWFQSIMGAAV